MRAAKKKKTSGALFATGQFSKKEAALKIASGFSHVHSAALGDRDAYARLTAEALKSGQAAVYPWENPPQIETVTVSASAERYQIAAKLINDPLVANRRKVRERLEVVLEELLTNALYHAYLNPTGVEKYPRKLPVTLAPQEKITVKYSISKEGVYLSVSDQGGNLRLSDMAAAFARTYGSESPEIQGKEGGAGLGIYMVFEATSHYKAICIPGKRCEISVWISDKRSGDLDHFSFNFFNLKE